MKNYARRAAAVGALTTILAGGLLAGGTPAANAAPAKPTTTKTATTQGPMPEICKVKNWPACDPWRR